MTPLSIFSPPLICFKQWDLAVTYRLHRRFDPPDPLTLRTPGAGDDFATLFQEFVDSAAWTLRADGAGMAALAQAVRALAEPEASDAPFGGGPLVAEPWESLSPERIGSVAGRGRAALSPAFSARHAPPPAPPPAARRRVLLNLLLLLRLLLLLLSEDPFRQVGTRRGAATDADAGEQPAGGAGAQGRATRATQGPRAGRSHHRFVLLLIHFIPD